MNYPAKTTLGDLGEFQLLDKIILPLARKADPMTEAGDDSAFVEAGGVIFAVTADVGPRPLIRNLIAHRDDWEASGWMAVVTTASDIAAAGARPLLLTNCVDAPADLEVNVLERFMSGYFRAMNAFDFRNGGGDLRQGPTLAARVFGVGVVEHRHRIGRSGSRPGDRLVLIGPAGSYMSHFLLAREAERDAIGVTPVETIPDALRFPRPQIEAMLRLSEQGFVRSASDTSDGLLGAIENIAKSSQCGFELDLDESLLSEEVRAASRLESVASPWNLFFAWGDWSVAAVIDGSCTQNFEKICRNNDIEWRYLGEAIEQPGLLTATLDGQRNAITPIRNENFVTLGFNAGIEGHLEYVLRTSVFTDERA